MSLLVPLAIAGLGFLGGERANSANAAQSAAQMNFQERLSNTAHQREAKDMKKAGINRILTGYGKGASTPAGAQAVMKDSITPALAAGLQTSSALSTIRLQNSQASKNLAETKNIQNIESTTGNVSKVANQVERVIDSIGNALTPEKLDFLKTQIPIDAKKAVDGIINTWKNTKDKTITSVKQVKQKILEIIHHPNEYIGRGTNPDKINYTDKKGRRHTYNNSLNELKINGKKGY